MAKKMTHDDFVKRVRHGAGEDFVVIGQYINYSTKIEMFHKDCGRYFSIRPADFLRRWRCSPCNIKKKKTTEEFRQEVEKLSNKTVVLMSEYINDRTKVEFQGLQCGHRWWTTPSHFIGGKRCPYCAGNIKKTTGQFKSEVFELEKSEYEVLSEYHGAFVKVKIKHNSKDCNNNEYMVTPSDFLQGKRCPVCSIINRQGENHFRYNPLLTDEERIEKRNYKKYRDWLKHVKEKYDYTCVKCSSKNNLHAHHIYSWNAYPDKREDINNGVVLCRSCHTEFHVKYGYGFNNEKQFFDYMKNANTEITYKTKEL